MTTTARPAGTRLRRHRADPRRAVRPAARHVPRRARPDDRVDGDAHHRRRARGPDRAGLGHDGLPDHLDDLDAALRQALRPVRPQAASTCSRSRCSSSGRCCAARAQSIYELAAYRAVQGVGAGGLMSLAFAIVGDLVPPRERGRYQAYFMAVFAHEQRPRAGARRRLRRPGDDPRDRRLALDLLRQRADRPASPCSSSAATCTLPRRTRDAPRRLRRRRAADDRRRPAAARGREGPRLGLGLRAHRRPGRRCRCCRWWRFVPWERRMGEEAILPLRVFRSSVFSLTSVMAPARRRGDVRRARRPAALPADRARRVADRARACSSSR